MNFITTHKKAAVVVSSAILAVVLVIIGLVLLQPSSDIKLDDVRISGKTFQTNLELSEYDGRIYAIIPINSQPEDLVLITENEADDKIIANAVEGIDTLVPGEHVIELSDGKYHFIVM